MDQKLGAVLIVHFSPEHTLVLFSQQLDSDLGKHKKKLSAEIDVTIGLQNVDKVSRSTVCTPKFKFEGNGRQNDFNASHLDEVSRAKELLYRGSTNLQ